MNIDMGQFLESFFEEASEHLENMEAALLQLESAPGDGELLNTVFRAAHSIKGASSTFGVHAVGEFTHVLESLLDRMRDGELQVTSESTELLLKSVDVLAGLLSAARDGTPEPENVKEVAEQLQRLNGTEVAEGTDFEADPTASAQQGNATYDVEFKPSKDFFHFGLDPLLLLRELAEMGTVSDFQVDASGVPALADLEPESSYLRWTLKLQTEKALDELQNVFMFVDDDTVVEFVPDASGTDASGTDASGTEQSQPPVDAASAPSVSGGETETAETKAKPAHPPRRIANRFASTANASTT